MLEINKCSENAVLLGESKKKGPSYVSIIQVAGL